MVAGEEIVCLNSFITDEHFREQRLAAKDTLLHIKQLYITCDNSGSLCRVRFYWSN